MHPKILIVEDDCYFAKIYQLHLSQAGYLTQIATNGSQALVSIDTFHPNLVILDLILPKIDGFTLLHFFKKIPVIVVSNLDQQDDMDKCKTLGAKIFITKESVDYHQLISQIGTLLHH